MDKNLLRSFLQYFMPHDQRTPNHIGMRRSSGARASKGRTPGAFGNPKQHRSLDSRISNHMRMEILREKARVKNAA